MTYYLLKLLIPGVVVDRVLFRDMSLQMTLALFCVIKRRWKLLHILGWKRYSVEFEGRDEPSIMWGKETRPSRKAEFVALIMYQMTPKANGYRFSVAVADLNGTALSNAPGVEVFE